MRENQYQYWSNHRRLGGMGGIERRTVHHASRETYRHAYKKDTELQGFRRALERPPMTPNIAKRTNNTIAVAKTVPLSTLSLSTNTQTTHLTLMPPTSSQE